MGASSNGNELLDFPKNCARRHRRECFRPLYRAVPPIGFCDYYGLFHGMQPSGVRGPTCQGGIRRSIRVGLPTFWT